MARSHQKGVDFQVSQSDMDLAVLTMEKNMKEGLERRQMQESTRSLTSKRQKSDMTDTDTVFSPTSRVSFDGS
eukprot:scaffold36236_cov58-Skeletonema_marinoi.AAC.1